MEQQYLARPRPPVRPGRALWIGGGCAAAALVVCLVAVMGAVDVWHAVKNYRNPPMPDVAAAANSDAVNDADLTATNSLNDEAAHLQQILPWLHPVARGVDDSCDTQAQTPTFGSRTTWTPITCNRELAWFGSFSGSLPAQLTRLNAALEHAGLAPQGTAINQLYAIDHARTPTLDSAYGSYDHENFAVGVAVSPPSDLQQLADLDRDVLTPTGSSPLPVLPGTAIRSFIKVTPAQLTAGATPQTYIIGLTFTAAAYYVAPGPSSSPTPQVVGGGCMTGGTCPGG